MKSITFTTLLLTTLAAATTTSPQPHILNADLGINCRGNPSCGIGGWFGPASLSQMRDAVFDNIDPNRVYQNGERIVCAPNVGGGGLCAFPQNTGGIPGSWVVAELEALMNHGCTRCGSVPVEFPFNGDNNPNDHGIFTVNFVETDSNCNGLCLPGLSNAASDPVRGHGNREVHNATQIPAPATQETQKQKEIRLVCTEELS